MMAGGEALDTLAQLRNSALAELNSELAHIHVGCVVSVLWTILFGAQVAANGCTDDAVM